MSTQFFSVGLIALLGAMSPGPDFAIVTKNSLLHARKTGLFTSLGLATALVVHMTYCILGMAVVISSSLLLFNIIKYTGALYLVYLGLCSLFAKQSKPLFAGAQGKKKTSMANFTAFRQGFLCNLLNPKATLFFLSLFTVLIKPDTLLTDKLIYAIEIVVISGLWFCSLTLILSHARVKLLLEKAEKYIVKFLGIFLIGFGAALALVKR